MSKYALVIDYKYCTGCHTCEVACRKEKNLPIDEWGIKLTEHGPAKLGGEWMWNYVPVPSSLCDLCEERIAEGKKPACVHHCLADCMRVAPVEEAPSVMAELGNGSVCFMP